MTFSNAIAGLRTFLYARTRRRLHYAAELAFQTIVYGAALVPGAYLLSAIGIETKIDYRLLGHFLGPLGLGAIVAGSVREVIRGDWPYKTWLVSSTFGGVTGMTFAILVSASRPVDMPMAAVLGFIVGAAFFSFLGWLQSLEAKRASAA